MTKKLLILFVCLILNINFALAQDLSSERDVVSSPTLTAEEAKVSEDTAAVVDEEQLVRNPFESGIQEGVPVGPGNVPAVSVSGELILQGIALNSKAASVVINGKTYTQGAQARQGIEVVEVRKGEADIKVGGVSRTLKFSKRQERIKKDLKSQVSMPAGPGSMAVPGRSEAGSTTPPRMEEYK